MSRKDILFKTERFNLSIVKKNFINPCCFGEDLATWARELMISRGMSVAGPEQEDWGWYLDAELEGIKYFIGISGNADEEDGQSNNGEWRIMIENKRSLGEKLFGKNKLSEDDRLVVLLLNEVKAQADFSDVRQE
jgi:hypothetical protein